MDSGAGLRRQPLRGLYLHASLLRELCATDDCLRRLDARRQAAFSNMLETVQRQTDDPKTSPGYYVAGLALSSVLCAGGCWWLCW